MSTRPVAEVFPLLSTDAPARIADWAVAALGLVESWRAPPDHPEHVELHWPGGGKVSVNLRKTSGMPLGGVGISLRIDDRSTVDQLHARAVAAGAKLIQGVSAPEVSRVAYSFTAVDPDGNEWWINAETGFLDELRAAGPQADPV